MRKFNITINGNNYEVDVEEVGGAVSAPRPAAPAAKPASKVAAPAPKTAAPAPKAAPVAVSEGSTTVPSPMPGTILDIRVKVGDTVKTGDVLLILEAMKMENEIMAPQAGRIASIAIAKGASVNSGEVLIVIE